MNDFITLSNGVKMPVLNFGTGALQNVTESVINAIKCGIRAIDTAQSYGNEEEIGEAIFYCIQNNIVKREDLFIVCKLNAHEPISYEIAKDSFYESLKKLKIDYADQYLIHAPNMTSGDKWKKLNAEVWQAFEELYEKGDVKSIGISNFNILHIEELLKTAKIEPMINQIDLNPRWQHKELFNYCKNKNIALSAAYSLVFGREMKNPLLFEVASKYHKTVPNVLLKWSCQKGYMPIFRSSNIEHLKQNIDIDDFELSKEDMDKIDTLNSHPTGNGSTTPESWFAYLSIVERLSIVDSKIKYKLFGKITILTAKRKQDGSYLFKLLGLPLWRKKPVSGGYQYFFLGVPFLKSKIVKMKTQHLLPHYKD